MKWQGRKASNKLTTVAVTNTSVSGFAVVGPVIPIVGVAATSPKKPFVNKPINLVLTVVEDQLTRARRVCVRWSGDVARCRADRRELGANRPDVLRGSRYVFEDDARRARGAELLPRDRARRGVVCAARDGNVRLAVHFYDDEDDIARATQALVGL